MIKGRCLCGAANYESPGPGLFSIVCHCRDCQRASGSGGVPELGVGRASFAANGPIKQVRTRGSSGHSAVRNICIDCGSLLLGTPESAPNLVTIYAGTLDDSTAFVPDAALFVSQRPPWATLALPLVEHPRMPP